MKKIDILPLIPLWGAVAVAQMPTAPQSFDATGKSTQTQAGVHNDDPNRYGETPPPQIFGMELPLLDPSTDTASYNGVKFDVGNNRMVRERFEKFLSQSPDDTEASRKYRRTIEKLIDLTQKYSKNTAPVGSKLLVKIGTTLYDISDYPGDGQQAGTLASGIVSALDAQRANLRRNRENEDLDAEIEKLVKKTNSLTNQNTQKGSGDGNIGNIQGKSGAAGGISHTVRIAFNTQQIAEHKAAKGTNVAANEAALAQAKIYYQAMVLTFFLERRFDHAVIGARIYRHVFKDGDTKINMDKNSDAYQMITGITGMPPTIHMLDSAAANARRDIDQSMDAITNLIAQNRLGEATNRLITAVSVGEFMQSVAVFPAESRRRIAEYWTLRKNALISLNARDYETVEQISAKMKELDVDYNDSLLSTYVKGKKDLSNGLLLEAEMAFHANNKDEGIEKRKQAAVVWPKNPAFKEFDDKINQAKSFVPVINEFKQLVQERRLREIYDAGERFEVVAQDATCKAQYKAICAYVAEVDAVINKMREQAKTRGRMGAGAAYEELLVLRKKDNEHENELLRGFLKKDVNFSNVLREVEAAAGDFIKVLSDAESKEKSGRYGAAYSLYSRALDLNPTSLQAKEGIERTKKVILEAQFD